MTLSNLGDYIELCTTKNVNDLYGPNDVRGISTQKKFIKSKADVNNLKLTNFNIVEPGCFSFNPNTARMGEKICVSFNDTNETYIVSAIYPVFKIKDENLLNPKFLMIYFNRSEFDRYARYNSWGSARETFSFEDFCNIELEIPPISIQQKYVDIYNGLLLNLSTYEARLEDLKLLCDMYIERIRKTKKSKLIGLLYESDEKNELRLATKEKGVSIQKIFIDTKAQSSDISKQKLVRNNYFAFNSNTSRNSDTISIALNREDNYAVSNTYVVFKANEDVLIPEYLYLWFKRKEFDRFARFNSWGSARETITLDDIMEYEIAIPDLKVQSSIVKVLKSYEERKEYIDILKSKIAEICPILIRGAVKEAKGGN